jgi:hypothetical protein
LLLCAPTQQLLAARQLGRQLLEAGAVVLLLLLAVVVGVVVVMHQPCHCILQLVRCGPLLKEHSPSTRLLSCKAAAAAATVQQQWMLLLACAAWLLPRGCQVLTGRACATSCCHCSTHHQQQQAVLLLLLLLSQHSCRQQLWSCCSATVMFLGLSCPGCWTPA